MEKTFDKNIKNFMNATAKSTIAVIVPLYGFWGDIPNNPINGELLVASLARLYSYVHQLIVIFVAHPQSLPYNPEDQYSVASQIMGWVKGGNTISVPVSRDATYSEYISEGMRIAREETKAQFMVVLNPWVAIQDGGLDVLVDRCNRSDQAKIICGFDLGSIVKSENFDLYTNSMPKEIIDVCFDFLSMPRWMAETVTIDNEYLTHVFLQRDLWQQSMSKGFTPLTTEKVPIFSFDFPWSDYETRADFEADRQKFNKKWGFDPGLLYADPTGASRKDKAGAR